MKQKLHAVIIAALFAAAAPAAAQEKPHAQQDKFAHCAHESKGLKGEERNKFMSDCLKSHDTHADKPRQEKPVPVKEARNDAESHDAHPNRMKGCNDEAARKSLHGDERRAFMSACLKARD